MEESIAGIEGIDYLRSTTQAGDAARSSSASSSGATSRPRPTTCAIGSAAFAAACPTRSTSRSSPRSRPTRSRSSISRSHRTAIPPLEITDFADRFVKDRLQSITGVAEARIFGERRYAMRIWLDAARLAAYNLTPQDVENALRKQNVEVPAGRIESKDTEFTVLAETDLRAARSVRRHHRQAGGRLSGALARRRPSRARPAGRTGIGPFQRPAGGRDRRRQAGGRQSARHLQRRARRVALHHRPICPRE